MINTKKYVLPTIDLIISLTVLIVLSIRDNELYSTIFSVVICFGVYGYLIINLYRQTNPIKVKTATKIYTFAASVLLFGAIYEYSCNRRIGGEAENILTMFVAGVSIFIWLYDYFLKPYLKLWLKK